MGEEVFVENIASGGWGRAYERNENHFSRGDVTRTVRG